MVKADSKVLLSKHFLEAAGVALRVLADMTPCYCSAYKGFLQAYGVAVHRFHATDLQW